MNAHQKQIEALVRKLRAFRNRGGSKNCGLAAQIKKLNAAWTREQRAKLKAIEAQLDKERKKRLEELGQIIRAEAARDYQAALAAISYVEKES